LKVTQHVSVFPLHTDVPHWIAPPPPASSGGGGGAASPGGGGSPPSRTTTPPSCDTPPSPVLTLPSWVDVPASAEGASVSAVRPPHPATAAAANKPSHARRFIEREC
jgi:hypothetical protein